MAWGTTLTATGTYANAAGATADVTAAFNRTLPSAPSGGNGFITIFSTSGAQPSAAVTGITTGQVTMNVPANSSGHVYAIVGHSVIA